MQFVQTVSSKKQKGLAVTAANGTYMLSSVKNFMITFCVAILLFGLVAYLIVNFAIGKMFAVTDPSQTPTDSETDTSITQPDPTITEDMAGESFTVLLIGTDYQPDIFPDYNVAEQNQNATGFPVRARTINADTIMIVRIDKETQTFVFSSLPRELQVTVNGTPMTLMELYRNRGINFFCDEITALTGYHIDYYVTASIPEFAAVIDLLDGISFIVPTSMHYEDPIEGLIINLPAGKRTLNGYETMQMLRYCSYGDGDLSRMALAIDFSKALLSKFTSSDYRDRAADILEQIGALVTTNFTSTDLAANIDLIFAYSKFQSITITYPGTYSQSEDGEKVFIPQTTNALAMYLKYR